MFVCFVSRRAFQALSLCQRGGPSLHSFLSRWPSYSSQALLSGTGATPTDHVTWGEVVCVCVCLCGGGVLKGHVTQEWCYFTMGRGAKGQTRSGLTTDPTAVWRIQPLRAGRYAAGRPENTDADASRAERGTRASASQKERKEKKKKGKKRQAHFCFVHFKGSRATQGREHDL